MKVKVRGKGTTVNLTKKHFLAKGGEGSIYVRPPVVYKIFEPGKMVPEGKIKELSVLDNPRIIRPKDVLLDSKNKSVGYTMDYVKNTHVLCQFFTKAFRKRNNISHDMIWNLVQDMEKTTKFIHSKGVLVVDYNELNFLVDENFKKVYFIDVNSYQTPNYRADAIMESIRDRHCKNNNFNQNTDWFAHAIVSFQMLVGIHPFKGKHPNFPDLKTSLDARMQANISIFDPNVRYPKGAVQPFSVIPNHYLEWYKAVFNEGKRLPPPGAVVPVVIVTPIVKTVTGNNNFMINPLFDFKQEILNVHVHAEQEIVTTKHSFFVNHNKMNAFKPQPNSKVVVTPDSLRPIAASRLNGELALHSLNDGSLIPCTTYADDIMAYDNRLYVRSGGNVLEVEFTEIGSKIIASLKQVSSVLEQAVIFYDGVIEENLFDAHYFTMFPESGICRQIALRDLDDYKIVDAKYSTGVLAVIGVDKKTGHYNRFMFCFDENWNYTVTIVKDVVYSGLNFTVLDNGICILINEDEDMEIFSVKNPSKKKVIQDDIIEMDMKLTSSGSTTMFTKGEKLYSIKMT
jgi:serine/threonine protein kinase